MGGAVLGRPHSVLLCYHITCHGTNWRMHRAQTHFWDVLAKDAKPKSNHEEPLDKLQLRNILQNNWPVILVNVKIMKDKKKLRDCSR